MFMDAQKMTDFLQPISPFMCPTQRGFPPTLTLGGGKSVISEDSFLRLALALISMNHLTTLIRTVVIIDCPRATYISTAFHFQILLFLPPPGGINQSFLHRAVLHGLVMGIKGLIET